ncbi:MAG: alpha/beta hydrolase, partial [Ramlibacter sp.]|nr:alpha/beta hydrolase [Ramlibacter sp.]
LHAYLQSKRGANTSRRSRGRKSLGDRGRRGLRRKGPRSGKYPHDFHEFGAGAVQRRPADTIGEPMLPPSLDPDLPALRRFMPPVGSGHLFHVQEWGRADGLPALVLHGGPGSGCSPLLARFFDPQRYRVICPDQRGSGRSSPAAGLTDNTTAHLLADLRQLRRACGIARWLVMVDAFGSFAAHGSFEAAQVAQVAQVA